MLCPECEQRGPLGGIRHRPGCSIPTARLEGPNDGRLHRNAGPTEVAGARSRGIPTQRDRVWALFEQYPAMTDNQLYYRYIETHGDPGMATLRPSLGTRRKELVKEGLVADSGRTERDPVTRKEQIVWEAVRSVAHTG